MVITRSRPSRASAVSAVLGRNGSTAMTEADGANGDRRERAKSQPPRRVSARSAPTPATQARFGPTTRSTITGAVVADWLSASANCVAVGNRSAGDRARTEASARSTDSGTVSRTVRTEGTGLRHPLGDDGLRGRSGVGRLPRQHLVQHAAQCVEIAPAVDLPLGHRLLRAHVGRRADGEAGLRQALAPGGVDRPGDAEVGHPRVPAREHDVLGLDVAVNDPAGMGIAKRLGDLARHLEGVVERQLLLALHAVAEGLPRDVGHDVVEQPPAIVGGGLDHAAVEEGQDVRMVELGGDGDLAEEPLGAERVGELGVEDLDRHRAVVLEIVREVDGGHAALAQLPLDAVAVRQCLGKTTGCVRHLRVQGSHVRSTEAVKGELNVCAPRDGG